MCVPRCVRSHDPLGRHQSNDPPPHPRVTRRSPIALAQVRHIRIALNSNTHFVLIGGFSGSVVRGLSARIGQEPIVVAYRSDRVLHAW
jgi:hypothetical protein